MSPRAKEFIQWVKTSRPEVIIAFNNVHHAIFRSEFHSETPYICLHAEEGEEESGVLEAMPSVARQAVNLLHFCRRTHQWGIPKERIDHVVEPIWFEGKTLPEKSEEWAP